MTRLRALALLLALAFAGSAGGAGFIDSGPQSGNDAPQTPIALVGTPTSAVNATNNTALSVTQAVGASVNGGCTVIGWSNDEAVPRTVSTVKIDVSGTSLVRVGGTTKSTGAGKPEMGIDIWCVQTSISNASHTFDVVFSGNVRRKFITSYVFSNMNSVTPYGTIAVDNTDTTSPVSMSPTGGTSNDLQIGGLQEFDGTGADAMGVTAGTTQRGTTQNDSGQFGLNFITGSAAGDASSIGFTYSTSSFGNVGAGVVVFHQ